MKLGLKDTLALLTKGYSKKEIDEMIALDQEAAQKEEQKKDKAAKNEKQDPEPEKKEEPEKDYKKLYEESQKALMEAQKNNARADISDELMQKQKEADDSLKKLVQSFM